MRARGRAQPRGGGGVVGGGGWRSSREREWRRRLELREEDAGKEKEAWASDLDPTVRSNRVAWVRVSLWMGIRGWRERGGGMQRRLSGLVRCGRVGRARVKERERVRWAGEFRPIGRLGILKDLLIKLIRLI